MMTPEQIELLQRKERALLDEWQLHWQNQHPDAPWFNADGIVDYARWAGLPDGKRILVLLKETNGLQGSLTEFLRHGGSKTYWRTWNNVARWTNLVLNGTYWQFVPRDALDDMVRNIAVVNLKKYAGGARANRHEVMDAAKADLGLLQRQIALYAPDIVLTGDAAWNPPNQNTALWYYETSKLAQDHKTLVVSMPHPNRAAKRWTLELEKVLRVTGRL